MKSAKVLLQHNLYENSISMAYYAMYNLLMATLFKTGIKCENHSGPILLLKLLFKEDGLFKQISEAKKERIDKQYYVTIEKDEITRDVAEELLRNAEDFVLDIKVFCKRLTLNKIEDMRCQLKLFID